MDQKRKIKEIENAKAKKGKEQNRAEEIKEED